MKQKIICLHILFLFIAPLSSFCQETRKVNQELDNISSQYAECAAYYNLVYHAMISANQPEAAAAYGQLMEKALSVAMLAASEGRSTEMASKVTMARIEMYKKKMKQEAGNDNANISILINKYHFGCSEAIENPQEFIKRIKNETEKTNSLISR